MNTNKNISWMNMQPKQEVEELEVEEIVMVLPDTPEWGGMGQSIVDDLNMKFGGW